MKKQDNPFCQKIKINYDNRGFFFESFRIKNFKNFNFVQDNISFSKKGVIRGMHYQFKYPQAKLLTLLSGEIFDVIIDMRRKSKNFMKIYSFILNKNSNNQLFIPRGFAHGFQCISKEALVYYKTDEYYSPKDQHGINALDKSLNIEWPIKKKILSKKDKILPLLSQALIFN